MVLDQRTRRALLVICFTIAIDMIGFGMVIPLLPMVAERFGASPSQIAWLSGSYSLMQLLFAPLWGQLSDRYGRRPILLFSIGANVVALSAYAFANSFTDLLLARGLSGICTANMAVASAYIADLLPEAQRARGMGFLGMSFGMGFVLGPIFGGELARFSPGAPALVAAVMAMGNVLAAYWFLPEASADGPSTPSAHASFRWSKRWHLLWQKSLVRTLLWIGMVQMIGFVMFETMLVLFAHRLFAYREADCGRLLALAGLVMGALQGGGIGRLVRRFGEVSILLSGLWGVVAGLLLLFFSGWMEQSIWMLMAVILIAAGQGLVGPTQQSLLSQQCNSDQRGLLFGTQQSLGALARGLAPLLAGLLFERYAPGAPFLVAAALLASAALAAHWVWRSARLSQNSSF